MHFIKTVLLAVLGLGAMSYAAPIENAVANSADITDGCRDAYRGDHRACESGREEKHDGRREENRGERELQHGNVGAGLADIYNGQRQQQQGQHRECRTGGRC